MNANIKFKHFNMDESCKLWKYIAFYIYGLFNSDAQLWSYYMHELEGLICKTAVSG